MFRQCSCLGCSSLSALASVVLHWYRRHVALELPVRHFAAVVREAGVNAREH